MFRQVATQSPVEILIQKNTHLRGRERVFPRFFKESDYLLAFYAWESLEKLLDRIARFQMIEKALHRNARPDKNRLTTQNFGILRYDAAHDDQNIASDRSSQNRSFLCR